MSDLTAVNLFESWITSDVETMVQQAPRYTHFNYAARRVIRAIHALPELLRDTELGNIEVYVGRAAATGAHVASRWNAHFKNRDHFAGIVAFRASTDDVLQWEGMMNRALLVLGARGRLCVANLAADSRGGVPEHEESVVYITFNRVRRRPVCTPTRADVEAIAQYLALTDDVSPEAMQRAFDPVSRPIRDRGAVEWALQ